MQPSSTEMKITDKMRVDFLLERLHVVSLGANWQGPRKRSYTDWGMRSFRHWRRWNIGDDEHKIKALDAAIRAQEKLK